MPPTRREVTCPNCGIQFNDSSAVIHHLNHPYSSCARWFISSRTPTDLPPDPAPAHAPASVPGDSGGTSIEFPFAGRVFGHSDGFMGAFHTDEFSEERGQNPFYPFSSKGEFQLASFLSRSGLSMRFINEFLSLDLVGVNLTMPTPLLTPTQDRRFRVIVQISEGVAWSCRAPPNWSKVAINNRHDPRLPHKGSHHPILPRLNRVC